MDGGHFQVSAQLHLDCRHLIPVRRDDADAFIAFLLQLREDFFPDHIDLPLIQVTTGMVSRRCPVHGQDIWLFVVLRHDDEFPTVEFLVAEIDDLYVYVNFSKDAPNETGYLQFSGTWADGIARYINWGNASSLEIAADSLEESLTSERMEIVESNQMMSAQFDVGLGLDSVQQMPFIYVSGIDANGTADSGVLLTITLTPEIMEKINMLREYIYQ